MAKRPFWREDDALLPWRWVAPWAAIVLLGVLIALVVSGVGVALREHPAPLHAGSAGASDARLYKHMIADVAAGQPYYQATARELRLGGYPLRPFMAVRPPLLTVVLGRLPGEADRAGALAALAAVTCAAWAWRLARTGTPPLRYAFMLLLLASGTGVALEASIYPFHEIWAGLLISLSLALYRPRRWGLSLVLGLSAALLRELAVPYLGAMALLALVEGRRGEAAAWSAAVVVFGLALAAHAMAVAGVVSPLDVRSPGWLGLGGWPFVGRMAQFNLILFDAPAWLRALVFAPALLGLLFWPGAMQRRVAFVVLGYVCGFCVVGRADNDYWGLLITPLWPLGLARSGEAIGALLNRCGALLPHRLAGARLAT